MQEIFKYFVGIIGVLILVYVLIVVLRTVLTSGFSNGAAIVTSTSTQANIASGTKDLVNAVGQFSLANWLRDFKPFDYAPVEVTVADRVAPKYYNDDFAKYDLKWQNLNDSGEAPNDHQTGIVPVKNSYFSENGESEEMQVSDKYIKPNLKPRSIVVHNSVLTGFAYYKVFSQREFPIYILDEYGNTFGQITAYANGDMKRDETALFRAVLDLRNVPLSRGFLMFKNENEEMSKIKAVTVVPVLFNK